MNAAQSLETTPKASPSSARRRSITRHDVIVAALELVDRDGLDELSMRKLAAALDVETMSLYKRVGSKDELLTGVADQVWSEVAAAASPGDDLGEWLQSLGHAIVETVRAHPKTLPVLLGNQVWPTSVLDVIATEVERLPATGPSKDDVYKAVCTVSAFALGCATLEISYLNVPTGDKADQTADPAVAERQRLRRVVRALPADTPDRLVDTALAVCGCDCANLFDVGIELIIRGCKLESHSPS